MSLGIRKVAVLALAAGVFLLANLWFVVNWLQEHGVVDVARHVRSEYIHYTSECTRWSRYWCGLPGDAPFPSVVRAGVQTALLPPFSPRGVGAFGG